MSYTSDSRIFEKWVNERKDAKKILAEGDSWFSYPRRFFVFGKPSNIIDHLEDKDDLLIYSTASPGDELMSMVSGEQKFSMIKRLAHNDFDFLLFSGGGNDIVGRYDFDFFIKKNSKAKSWEDYLIKKRLEIKLLQIKTTYELLCELVKQYSKNKSIKIITHTYDFAIPMKTGYLLFDLIPVGESWLYPFFMDKGIKNKKIQNQIVKYLLTQFKLCLEKVQSKHKILKVVNTQGLLKKDDWRNEIHPNPEGFGKIAKKIYDEGINI